MNKAKDIKRVDNGESFENLAIQNKAELKVLSHSQEFYLIVVNYPSP